MKFNDAAGPNPIDRQTVVGQPHTRIDGPLKTTGTAPYAYERHDVAPGQAYGYVKGADIAKGQIAAMDLAQAKAAPGVIAVVAATQTKPQGKGMSNFVPIFGGREIEYYNKAIALVVAETFEQARAAAGLIRVDYSRSEGTYDLAKVAPDAPLKEADGEPDRQAVGDFDAAFGVAPVTVDQTYTSPDETHAMMEPYASIAAWDGDRLTLWTSNQMIAWGKGSLSDILGIAAENIRLDCPYLGGGFGGKLFVHSDAVLAALGAKAAGRPVKVMLQRPLIFNNTSHRAATIQHVRIGAERDGRITAIAHDGVSGNYEANDGENAVMQSKLLYAGANRLMTNRIAALDLPEANAMRAPGEAVGHIGLEIAMDELAEKLGIDPIELRIINDTQVNPGNPDKPFSKRKLVECLRRGAEEFGWNRRNATPGATRDGRWLVGMGMAAGIRGNILFKSAARVRLQPDGQVVVETDMTDIGTGSYTILAQTAAEMMGVPLDRVTVRLGDSDFPVSCGSGGQFGAANSTSGVYAACVKLREQVAQKLGLDAGQADFTDGRVIVGNDSRALTDASADGALTGEDGIEYGDIADRVEQATFAGHFVELAVDAYTGETHLRRMLAVCEAGRILNPISARSQVIGAMTMGAGLALTEELAVDTRFGLFINHDLASYEVPVHADIPHQEVIFLDELDDMATPMKAKGVGELGICGVGPAIANAFYNATGVRVREFPITLDKYLDRLPAVA